MGDTSYEPPDQELTATSNHAHPTKPLAKMSAVSLWCEMRDHLDPKRAAAEFDAAAASMGATERH